MTYTTFVIGAIVWFLLIVIIWAIVYGGTRG